MRRLLILGVALILVTGGTAVADDSDTGRYLVQYRVVHDGHGEIFLFAESPTLAGARVAFNDLSNQIATPGNDFHTLLETGELKWWRINPTEPGIIER